MIWKLTLWIVTILEIISAAVIYDIYFGKPLKDKRRNLLSANNLTSVCTVSVDPCRIEDGRRVDGFCTNPKFPTRGSTMTPIPRVLPAKYGPGNTVRPASDGSELPSTRLIRTTLLPDGFVNHHPFTQLASHYFVFSTVDSTALDDVIKYAIATDCCVGNTPNRVNPQCLAIPVPEDDPYLRLTNIRCLNLTRVSTFQDMGCLPRTLPLERTNRATPLLDLSVIYGNNAVDERLVRQNKDGLLRSEMRRNKEYPPGNSLICVKNRLPDENICYEYGDQINGNVLSGTNLVSLWYYRQHNRFARELKRINPCWDDQKLFQTAKTINIAIHQHVFYYELIAEIMGRENALYDGVIYDTHGYVDDFDSRYEPGVLLEFLQAARWFHTFQDAKTDLYDAKKKYSGTRPTVDDEFRSGILEINNTEAQLIQGSFRQMSAKFDYVVDPELSERLLGNLHAASDLMSIDLTRGRDQGIQPYNEYRKVCGFPVAQKFEDFLDTIDEGRVEKLSRLYDDVDDVEFMAAVYSERMIQGGYVGPTLYCMLVKNLLLWRRSDLFFYEHGKHPARLTLPQLNEIRKSTVARLICDNGVDVNTIQPSAFYQIGHKNMETSCDNIPSIDIDKWVDPVCSGDDDSTSNKNSESVQKNNII